MREPLPFAPWGELCVALFRRFDAESDKYNDRELNSLPTDIIGWAEAASQICRHPAHRVALDRDVESKCFQRQLAGLQKIHEGGDHHWWKNFLLGQDLRAKFSTNIYAGCSLSTMSLLDISRLNTSQRNAIDSARHLPNSIGLITGSAATGKTAVLVAMVKPFLWAPSTKGANDDRVEAPAIKSAGEYYVEPLPDDHNPDKYDEDASHELTRAQIECAAEPTYDTSSGNNNCVEAPATKNAGKYCVESLPDDPNTDNAMKTRLMSSHARKSSVRQSLLLILVAATTTV